MSKLDDITLMFIGGIAASMNPIEGLESQTSEQVRLEYKGMFKDLILQLIGEDERLDDSDAEANQIRNVFRQELKQKVNQL